MACGRGEGREGGEGEGEGVRGGVSPELDRAWMRLQRRCWNDDRTIHEIKARRRKSQRRLNDANRRLHNRLCPLIGTPPETIELL